MISADREECLHESLQVGIFIIRRNLCFILRERGLRVFGYLLSIQVFGEIDDFCFCKMKENNSTSTNLPYELKLADDLNIFAVDVRYAKCIIRRINILMKSQDKVNPEYI
jgi:hypothetical protein